MAKTTLRRILSVVWDRDAARRLQIEAEDALEKAGKLSADALEEELKKGGSKGARALTTALRREYKLRMAQANQQLAEGAINEKAFRREGEKAAAEFNKGLSDGIRKLQTSPGGLTQAQYTGLAGRFKNTGAGAAGGGTGLLALAGRFAGPLAGYFTATAALSEARTAIEATNELEASVRRLGGTAKLAGLDLSSLRNAAAENKEEFKLGSAVANDLTGLMTRLADAAGDVAQATPALRAWLDLAAARGLTAAEAMQALEVTLRQQDEGLNKLGLANPSQIYEKWGAGADQASQFLAILNEVQSEGAKVLGSWSDAAETAGGQADQATQRIRDLQAEAGKAVRPFQLFALELKVGLLKTLIDIGKAWANPAFDPELGITGLPGRARTIPAPSNDPAAVVAGILQNGRSYTVPLGAPAGKVETPEEREARLAKAERARLEREALLDRLQADVERTRAAFEKAQADELRGIEGRIGYQPLAQMGQDQSPLEALPVDPDYWANKHAPAAEFFQRIAESGADAAAEISNAFQDTFALMMDEGATVGNFFEGLGRGLAGAMLGALADYAKGEAAKHFAEAIGAGAYALGFVSHGNFASASAAWAAAAEHTAAGVAFSALAGAASAGQGALRNRAPGSTYDAGLSITERTERTVPIIINVDPFNAANPVHTNQVGKAVAVEVRLAGKKALGLGDG